PDSTTFPAHHSACSRRDWRRHRQRPAKSCRLTLDERNRLASRIACRPLRDSDFSSRLPGTHVPGFPVPPLCGCGIVCSVLAHACGDDGKRFRRRHCTLCSRVISFWARFSSDSDHSKRPVAHAFFSILAVNSTNLCTLLRTFRSASDVNSISSCRNGISKPKSI